MTLHFEHPVLSKPSILNKCAGPVRGMESNKFLDGKNLAKQLVAHIDYVQRAKIVTFLAYKKRPKKKENYEDIDCGLFSGITCPCFSRRSKE